eukprot:2003869-Amphidinium_carterae.1
MQCTVLMSGALHLFASRMRTVMSLQDILKNLLLSAVSCNSETRLKRDNLVTKQLHSCTKACKKWLRLPSIKNTSNLKFQELGGSPNLGAV